MPVLCGPLFGFVLGSCFAAFAGEELRRTDRVINRPFVIVCLFSLLAYAPFCAHFLAFAPAWSLAYFVAPGSLPATFVPAMTLLCALSCPLGFVVGARNPGAPRAALLLRLNAVPIVIGVGSILGGLPRLTVFATYAQYQGDFGTAPVAGSPLGYALLWMTLCLVCAIVWTLRLLRKRWGDAEQNGLSPDTSTS